VVYNHMAMALRALLPASVSFNEQPGAVHPGGDLEALGLRSIHSGDAICFLPFVHSFLAVDKKRNPELDVASRKLQALMDCRAGLRQRPPRDWRECGPGQVGRVPDVPDVPGGRPVALRHLHPVPGDAPGRVDVPLQPHPGRRGGRV
jgi:hypothetical protein